MAQLASLAELASMAQLVLVGRTGKCPVETSSAAPLKEIRPTQIENRPDSPGSGV
jgi:hypothetical protein